MEYLVIGILVTMFLAQIGAFGWLIKHVEGIRRELTNMHTNSLVHIEEKIDKLEEAIVEHRLEKH